MRLLLGGLAAALLSAQTTALENTGRPMRLPFECGAEELHSFGLICPSEQPCQVYLELAGLEVVGANIVAAGNLHAENATLFSVLLQSGDGGKTWREPYERLRGMGLEQAQFLDFNHGWVSGESLGAVPRDPFLLLTQDGGKTWTNQPVFSESRAGLIDRFHFDSESHGTLWIDRSQSGGTATRYETYETGNGGRSWTLRESGPKPRRTVPRPTTPADWRVRADARSGAYRIEHRAGAGWETVASFLVQVGQCSEPDTPLPEPAPEPQKPNATP
jgi:photosystem II stability/assembly factor-like uncharacterized protein